jgi:hypothetical protein
MYLVTGLGQPFKPRSKAAVKSPPKGPTQSAPKEGWVTKNGHRRFCGAPSGRTVSCDLTLKVRFRRSFEEFLREVEGAYGRWMERSTARTLVRKLTQDLKQWHQELINARALNNDPIMLIAGLVYRRSNGGWLVDGSDLRQYWRLIDI